MLQSTCTHHHIIVFHSEIRNETCLSLSPFFVCIESVSHNWEFIKSNCECMKCDYIEVIMDLFAVLKCWSFTRRYNWNGSPVIQYTSKRVVSCQFHWFYSIIVICFWFNDFFFFASVMNGWHFIRWNALYNSMTIHDHSSFPPHKIHQCTWTCWGKNYYSYKREKVQTYKMWM